MGEDKYQVRDGPRLITFDGTLLGEVSSRRNHASRWTEMRVYKTVGGSYVLEKIGRSIVTHERGCSEILKELPRFQEAHPGDDPDEGYEYHSCVPDTYDFTQLLVEEDRYWAVVSEDPVAIVDALYRKRAGSRHLPRVSIDLLEVAGERDTDLANSWKIERIS